MLAACGKPEGGGPSPGSAASSASSVAAGKGAAQAAAPAATLLLAPEDLLTLSPSRLASGPVITGSIQPEKRADLRAELGAVVLQVLKENGQTVQRGDLLVRLDDTAIRDSLTSAQESQRASSQAFEQAERQVERLRTLQAQGMTSMQALEDAQVRRNNAQSDLVAARSRVATAQQQLRRTEVRAPFDGVLSERRVSAGDTVQVGRELVKVIDPRSMRFEGLVSADRLAELKPGLPVSFRINGFTQAEFTGEVRRVDATANPITRQVEVLVDFKPASSAPQVAGLFAEGRIDTGTQTTLRVPESAVVRAGEATQVWKFQGSQIQRVAVKLGERDNRRGEFPVLGGLASGDRVLRTPVGTLVDGQAARLAEAAAKPAAPSGGGASPATAVAAER
ncbi:secretion protein HlyD [beta proteobacterium AAP51]|nr:secretion protein HlyD [beta proteobacterium AAP51]